MPARPLVACLVRHLWGVEVGEHHHPGAELVVAPYLEQLVELDHGGVPDPALVVAVLHCA